MTVYVRNKKIATIKKTRVLYMCSHDNIKAKKHAMDDNINDVIISKPKIHARDFDIFSNVAYLFANLIKSHKFARCAYITCPGMQKIYNLVSMHR